MSRILLLGIFTHKGVKHLLKEMTNSEARMTKEIRPNGVRECLLCLEDFLDGCQKFVGCEGFWQGARRAEGAGDGEHIFGGDLAGDGQP